jgi:hypothetical protein
MLLLSVSSFCCVHFLPVTFNVLLNVPSVFVILCPRVNTLRLIAVGGRATVVASYFDHLQAHTRCAPTEGSYIDAHLEVYLFLLKSLFFSNRYGTSTDPLYTFSSKMMRNLVRSRLLDQERTEIELQWQ